VRIASKALPEGIEKVEPLVLAQENCSTDVGRRRAGKTNGRPFSGGRLRSSAVAAWQAVLTAESQPSGAASVSRRSLEGTCS
jgi:hypothetical protein